MIKTLEVSNLQGHKYSLLEFHKGVNIIKGRSHAGKSSLFRALQWALQNTPSGFHFKSHFAKEKDTTEVSIEFDNDEFISRKRDNKFNGYCISTKGELEALRTDLPDEVKIITKMDSINLQSQGDKYFMLQESPGTVAKELNKIVGLDIIDAVNAKVSKIVKDANSECVRIERETKEKKEEIKKYEHLDEIGKLIDQITSLAKKYKEYEDKENELILKIKELVECENDLEQITNWLEIEVSYKQMKKKWDRYVELNNKFVDVSKLAKQCKHVEDQIVRTNELISFENDTKKAKELVGELSEMQNKHIKLQNLCRDVQDTKKSLNFISDTLRIKIKEKSELLKAHANEFCSKCGAHMQYWRKK